jgi:hypothetical protein
VIDAFSRNRFRKRLKDLHGGLHLIDVTARRDSILKRQPRGVLKEKGTLLKETVRR